MKNLRNVLVSSAFIFAIGIAFALDASNSLFIQKYGEFTAGCTLGTLNQMSCGTNPWIYGNCTVTLGFQTVDAFDQIDAFGQCTQRLYKTSP